MKFRCEREDLLEAVQFASRAISNRATLPVLSGLRVKASESGIVELAGTDLEITMQTSFRAGIDEPGMAIVPGRLFGEMARSLGGGQVSLAGGDGELEIGSGRGEFRVKALASDDYPALPVDDHGDSKGVRVAVEGPVLSTALSQVVRSASADESRQVLTGVLWEIETDGLTLAATDSYRLAVRVLEISEAPAEPRKVILPARVLGELGRVLQTGVTNVVADVRDNLIVFGLGPEEEDSRPVIGSRFIEGDFPNYRQLLPEGYSNRLTVDREALLEVVKRVGLLAQNNMPVKLRLGDELEISAQTPDVGEGQETIDADYGGEPLVIAFNPQFLIDGGSAIQSQRLVLEAGDGLKPAVLHGENDSSFTYLLMPVRLS
jgi:DNA polymerase III subunit beta